MSKHVIADRAGPAMSANPVDEGVVDALYDELFRLGKHRHDPVPMDPKAIIRKHLAAARELMHRSKLKEAADELAWLHREYISQSPLSEGVPRITRLLQKIEAHTGHVTESPYPPPNT